MPYKIIDNVTSADVAVQITGDTIEELFSEAAGALAGIQIQNVDCLKEEEVVDFSLQPNRLNDLFFEFFGELIFLKDARGLICKRAEVHFVRRMYKNSLSGRLFCGKITPSCVPIVDVKGVSLHGFKMFISRGKYVANVVFDV